MKKYRYVEFIDGPLNTPVAKQGQLFIVAEKPESYVAEFSLIKTARGYYTTLEKIGELGWELACVTPCGTFAEHRINTLFNSYVFKKEIEE